MRKVSVPIALFVFLIVATPVFGVNVKPTNVHRPTDVGRPTDLPRPTNLPLPTKIPKPTDQLQGNDHQNGKFSGTDSAGSTVSAKAKRTQKLGGVIGRMVDNYQRRIIKYQDFLTKVTSRRDKLAAAGKDVSKLDSFITTATDNVNTAKTLVANVKTTLGNLDLTGDMGALRKTIHDQLTLIRLAMTTLHKSMSETVAEIIKLPEQGTITPVITQ